MDIFSGNLSPCRFQTNNFDLRAHKALLKFRALLRHISYLNAYVLMLNNIQFQKGLYNFESLYKFIDRECTVF
jgi:hypothetical protein